MALGQHVDDYGNPLPYPPDDDDWPTPLAPNVAHAPTAGDDEGAAPPPGATTTTPPPTTTTTTPPPSGGGSWFDNFAPSQYAQFGETYSALARPDYLRGEYKPPTWNESFRPPTMDDVKADPGFQTGLNAGILTRERSAAARGSILSGGQQKALTRYGTDYGNTYYGETTNRLFDQYKQRYGQFLDSANLGAQARGINETAFGNDSANNLNQYNTRYRAYQDAIGNDLASRGLDLQALNLARPTGA